MSEKTSDPRSSGAGRKWVAAWLLGFAILWLGWNDIRRVRASFSPPFVYWKDCAQPYLMGKALLNDVDPYAPLPELGREFLPLSRFANYPTPYPPFVGLLGLPMALLGYETAAWLWLAGEIACLLGSLFLLLRACSVRLNPLAFGFLFAVVLALGPVSEELRFGQFMSGLLLLLCGAWLALRRNHDVTGGVVLGLIICIKLIAWPIVVLLALRGRWRAAGAAALSVLAIHAMTLTFFSLPGLMDYYSRVGPLNASIWRPAEENYSVWGWGDRLFSGFGFSVFITPLWTAPRLAAILTPVLPTLCLALALWLGRRANRFDTAFSIATGASLLVSPIFWHFYLLLAAIPVAVAGGRLSKLGWPTGPTTLAVASVSLLSVPVEIYESAARSLTPGAWPGASATVPFGAGLVLLMPVAALLALLFVIWRTDPAKTPIGT